MLLSNDKIIISLLSSLITGEKMPSTSFRDTSAADWKQIFELACPHGVAALMADASVSIPAECLPPKSISIALALQAEKAENSYRKKCVLIKRISEMLESHGYEFVLLKGASTASYYPVPEHRYFGDIDFYVLRKDTGAIASLEADSLISQEFHLATDTSHHHHNTYSFEGVLLENHYNFIEIHSHTSSRSLENELQHLSLAPRSKVSLPQLDGSIFAVSKAPATFNAVFLLRHMASHFAAAEIGLRHILDYALFLKAEHSNIDFDTVRELFESHHLTPFASAVNTILTSELDLPKEFTSGQFSDIGVAVKVLTEIIHPHFPIYGSRQSANPLTSLIFRTRRFFSNRWKHDLVYPENFYATLLRSSWSHLLKPKSLIK